VGPYPVGSTSYGRWYHTPRGLNEPTLLWSVVPYPVGSPSQVWRYQRTPRVHQTNPYNSDKRSLADILAEAFRCHIEKSPPKKNRRRVILSQTVIVKHLPLGNLFTITVCEKITPDCLIFRNLPPRRRLFERGRFLKNFRHSFSGNLYELCNDMCLSLINKKID